MQNRRAKIHGERGGEEGPGKAGMRAKVPCSLTAVLSLNSNDILCLALVARWKRISQLSSWLGELMTCKWVWVRIVLAVVVVVNFSENSHEFFFFSILTCALGTYVRAHACVDMCVHECGGQRLMLGIIIVEP